MTEEPVQESKDYSRYWNPRRWLIVLGILRDQWFYQGCARMTTKATLKEIKLKDNPDVFEIGFLSTFLSRRKVYGYTPEVEEVETMPFREKRMPVRANLKFPFDKDNWIVDVDGRRLEEQTMDDEFKLDKNLSKCYLVIGIFYHHNSEPYERLFRIGETDNFFKKLHREVGRLRFWRRFFSLKDLSGFGIYRVSCEYPIHCIPTEMHLSAILSTLTITLE
jgi:hypothetical protein